MPLNESELETKNDDGVDDSHAESIVRMATQLHEADNSFTAYERHRAIELDLARALRKQQIRLFTLFPPSSFPVE
jgi:hypothetical protein